jgi:hypothetical protein
LNILAIGSDVTIIKDLFEYSIKEFSSKERTAICHQHWNQDLSFSMIFSKEKFQIKKQKIIQGGSAMLASSSGICFIETDLQYLPKSQLNELKQILETRRLIISTENDKTKVNSIKMTKKCLKNTIKCPMTTLETDSLNFHFDDAKIDCNFWTFYETSICKKLKNKSHREMNELNSLIQ